MNTQGIETTAKGQAGRDGGAEAARTSLHLNHRFLIGVVEQLVPEGAAVLDFGCGKGDLVAELLRRGWAAHGVEYFGSGSGVDIRGTLAKRGLLDREVLAYGGTALPYADAAFDVVLSNQVFEHVPDLHASLLEIRRVLKPGGWLVCSFPSRDAIREPHCNVPLAHRLPRSRARFSWLLLFRSAGIGRLKRGRSRIEWAHFFNDWLAENTHYRSRREIERLFRDVFGNMQYFEQENIRFRLANGGSGGLAAIPRHRLVDGALRWVARNFGSLFIRAQKEAPRP